HVLVARAEAAHPIGDIAGLAALVDRAMPVEDAALPARALAQRHEMHFLREPGLGTGAVAEDEEVEMREYAPFGERAVDRLDTGYDVRRGFIIGRHQQRGARGKIWQRPGLVNSEAIRAAAQERQEPGECSRKGERNPGEQQNVEHEDDGFESREA